MDIILPLLILLGILVYLIGVIGFLIAAFRESVLWGLACLFVPIVQLFFLIIHWDKAKRPFGLQLLGVIIFLVGFVLMPPGTTHH